MKKILLSLMLIVAFASMNTAKAQCDLAFSNLSITASPGVPIGSGSVSNPFRCQYTFNASFDITTNQGFKFLYFHSWLVDDYPNIFNCTPNGSGTSNATNPGDVTQLGTTIWQAGKSILDFGFNDVNTGAWALNVTNVITDKIGKNKCYPNNDNNTNDTVALNTATSATVKRIATNVLHFEITGIVVEILGPCGGAIAVKTDVWGANQAGSQGCTSKSKISAQCYICNRGNSFNDPSLTLTEVCGTQRSYSFSITSSALVPTVYDYTVYFHDPVTSYDAPVKTGSVTLSAEPSDLFPTSYSSPSIMPDAPYCCTSPWSEWDMRLDVTSPSFTNIVSTGNLGIGCSPLPVNLKSFNAARKNTSTVDLKWETAQEENSKGFYVERKLSNGGWQAVTFVESKAIRGNSSTPLSYEFTDLNNAKGISQYRLRQVDIDGKQAYSQIRSVRGEGQKSKTIIYPNPSGDGKVNIVFENGNSRRDVSLMDVSGKTLRQWKGVTNNNIQIDNLNAGFYTVRIVNNETGEHVVEKFIVNKR
jgi:hypothetical protein